MTQCTDHANLECPRCNPPAQKEGEKMQCEHNEIQERYCLNCNAILGQDDEIEALKDWRDDIHEALGISSKHMEVTGNNALDAIAELKKENATLKAKLSRTPGQLGLDAVRAEDKVITLELEKAKMVEAGKRLLERIDNNGGLGEYKGGPAFVLKDFREIISSTPSSMIQDLKKVKEAVGLFVDDNPCRFDHHGGCQEHYGYDDNMICLNTRAKEALTILDGMGI